MKVTGKWVKVLLRAMEGSFSPDELDRLLVERWDMHLYQFAGNGSMGTQALAVLTHFNARYIAEELLIALRDARPRHPDFIALADLAGFTVIGAGLEAYLVPGQDASPDAVDFRGKLAQCENYVCRIETGNSRGTGVLIGPNLVLTNHHVAKVGAGNALPATVFCLFDHKIAADGYSTPALRVKVARALAWSPTAPEDGNAGAIATDPDRLDYALLELEEDTGSEAIVKGFEARGYAPIGDAPGIPALNTGIITLQHPLAQPMKVDLGSVTSVAPTRIWHNAGTTKGSSGAPLFDVQLRLVALHHAGYESDAAATPHNQAIPISLIAADLRRKQIELPT